MGRVKLELKNEMFAGAGAGGTRVGFVPVRGHDLTSYYEPDLGTGTTINQFDNISYDEKYGVLYLTPLQLSAHYNNVSETPRLAKSNFSFVSGDESNWDDTDLEYTGNTYIVSSGSSQEVTSAVAYGADRGYFIKFTLMPTAKIKQCLLHFKFGGKFKLDVYEDGLTVLYKNDLKVADGHIRTGFDKKYAKQYTTANTTPLIITLVIMPMLTHGLYIYSPTFGGGWIYNDKSVESGGTITEQGTFSFKLDNTATHIQVMPLTYPSSGSVTLANNSIIEPKGTFSSYYKASAWYETNITIPEPTIIHRDSYLMYVTIALTADSLGKYTPFLAKYIACYTNTEGATVTAESIEITKWRDDSLVLNMSNDQKNRTLNWIMDYDGTTESQDMFARLVCRQNITVLLSYIENEGDTPEELFIGLTNTPTYSNPLSPELSCSAQDFWKRLMKVTLPYNFIADGMELGEAVQWLLLQIGFPEDRLLINTVTNTVEPFYIEPDSGAKNLCEFPSGTPVAEILTKIRDDYAPVYEMGFRPVNGKVMFVFQRYDSNIDADYTLYNKISEEHTEEDTFQNDGFSIDSTEPECTQYMVMGEDEDGVPVCSSIRKEELEDPTVSIDSRTQDWVGERRYVGEHNTGLWDKKSVNYYMTYLFYFLSKKKYIIAFKNLSSKPHVGDIVYLEGVGTVRIIGISQTFGRIIKNEDDTYTTHYVSFCNSESVDANPNYFYNN